MTDVENAAESRGWGLFHNLLTRFDELGACRLTGSPRVLQD